MWLIPDQASWPPGRVDGGVSIGVCSCFSCARTDIFSLRLRMKLERQDVNCQLDSVLRLDKVKRNDKSVKV